MPKKGKRRPGRSAKSQGPSKGTRFAADDSHDELDDMEDDISLCNVHGDEEDLDGGPDQLEDMQPQRKSGRTPQGDKSPLILLFDLNGVLVSERETGSQVRNTWKVRPGIEQLLRLHGRYHLGVFSSAKPYNVMRAVRHVLNVIQERAASSQELAATTSGKTLTSVQYSSVKSHRSTAVDVQQMFTNSPGAGAAEPGQLQLFDLILARDDCAPDPSWRTRPGGNAWDTIKPLADNGLPVGRVLVVDNELRKAAGKERDSFLLLPTWEHCNDEGLDDWERLIHQLVQLSDQDRVQAVDVRQHTQGIGAALSEVARAHAESSAQQLQPQQLQDGSPAGKLSKKQKKKLAQQQQLQAQQQQQESEADEGREPARKLRRTAAAHDVHEAVEEQRGFVTDDGYLLPFDEENGLENGLENGQENGSEDEGDMGSEDWELEEGLGQGGRGRRGGVRSMDQQYGDAADELVQEGEDQMWSEDLEESEGDLSEDEISCDPEGDLDGSWQGMGGDGDADGYAHVPLHVGHKRGRQLPGAVPLYNGPKLTHPQPVQGQAQASKVGSASASSAPAQHAAGKLSELHYQIAAFAAASAPSDEQLALVDAAVAQIQAAAQRIWPHSRAVLFGSQAAGLALPGSDLDVVILGALKDVDTPEQLTGQQKPARKGLNKLVSQLTSSKVLASFEIVGSKVPIIKARILLNALRPAGDDAEAHRLFSNKKAKAGKDPRPCMMVDISIGAANGAAAVGMMQRCVQALPPLRPLCLLVKALLRDAGLNEVFTGGLSSYSVFNLVLAHLQCEGYHDEAAAAMHPPGGTDLQAVRAATHQHAISKAQSLSNPPAAAHGEAAAAGTGPDLGQQADLGQPFKVLDSAQMAFLRHVQQSSQVEADVAGHGYDLGDLLTSLLYRYGHVMDWSRECVSVRRGGVASKSNLNLAYERLPLSAHRLVVEDPQQVRRDLCTGSFNTPIIRLLLRAALQQLLSRSHHDSPCTAIPPLLCKQPPPVTLAQQFAKKGRRADRSNLGRPSSLSNSPNAPTLEPAANLGHLGRQMVWHVLSFGPNQRKQHRMVAMVALERLAHVLAGWKGWSADRQAPAPLPRAQHISERVTASRAAAGLPECSAGPSQPAEMTDEEKWAAVQADGTHRTVPAPAPGSCTSGVQPWSLPWPAPPDLSWAYILSSLFNLPRALGFESASAQAVQQIKPGGMVWTRESQELQPNPPQGGAAAQLEPVRARGGVALAPTAAEQLTARQLKIRAAADRRKLARVEQKLAAMRANLAAALAKQEQQGQAAGVDGGAAAAGGQQGLGVAPDGGDAAVPAAVGGGGGGSSTEPAGPSAAAADAPGAPGASPAAGPTPAGPSAAAAAAAAAVTGPPPAAAASDRISPEELDARLDGFFDLSFEQQCKLAMSAVGRRPKDWRLVPQGALGTGNEARLLAAKQWLVQAGLDKEMVADLIHLEAAHVCFLRRKVEQGPSLVRPEKKRKAKKEKKSQLKAQGGISKKVKKKDKQAGAGAQQEVHVQGTGGGPTGVRKFRPRKAKQQQSPQQQQQQQQQQAKQKKQKGKKGQQKGQQSPGGGGGKKGGGGGGGGGRGKWVMG